MKVIQFIVSFMALCFSIACHDNENFTTSPYHQLSFSVDTVKMDTVFSNVPSSTKSFWIYNLSEENLRLSNVRLKGGNQTGFRVNIDGTYLSSTLGYQTSGIEVRSKDSVRVFVEVTTSPNLSNSISLVEDQLIFSLESGVEQQLALQAHTWDAISLRDLQVKKDTIISSTKPLIIYGGINVDSTATLRIAAGTQLFFHADAGIDVYGKLHIDGSKDKNVILRGDRLDRMFDYLPYNRISGQWRGIHYHLSSYNNTITYTNIYNPFNGIVTDSSDVTKEKLYLSQTTIHNCQGYGILANNCAINLENVQITNTLNDCLQINGGKSIINNSTFAQFYPFDSKRGIALRLTESKFTLVKFTCNNSIITGYNHDEIMLSIQNSSTTANYTFNSCIIRTPKVSTADSTKFIKVIYENLEDTLSTGVGHFTLIDTEKLYYDFRLRKSSAAIDKANTTTASYIDRRGVARDTYPDIGAYEYTP